MSANVLPNRGRPGQYRVWYHYNKPNKCMTVHWRGKCLLVDEIVCLVPMETKTDQRQPHYVLRGWANNVRVKNINDETTLAEIV